MGVMEEKAKRLNPFVHDILGAIHEHQLTLSDIIYITTTIQMQSIKGIEAHVHGVRQDDQGGEARRRTGKTATTNSQPKLWGVLEAPCRHFH